MPKLTHLPHVHNIQAAINRWDPQHKNVFEVYFTLPDAIKGQFAEDEVVLTEQVTRISGLDALQKNTEIGKQRFMGVDVSFANPVIQDTRADLTIEFNLNLRNEDDNYVLKIFKAWKNLNYNMADGTRTLKREYVADNLRVAEANRNGVVWRSYVFHDILIGEITGLDELDYDSNDPQKLTVKFVSDSWNEDVA